MSELQDVVNSLVGRLKEHRAVYQQNEMAVRNQLINPTLRALGWDPENPSLVLHNISTDEGVPDYSLMKSAKRLLFLEAKKLSIDVERPDAIRQLAKYSFAEGTKFGLLTNGAVWLLVRSFQEGTTLAERVVWKADLEGEDLVSVCRKLVTVSVDNVDHIDVLVKKAQILDEVWQSLTEDPQELVNGLLPVVRNVIGQSYPTYQFTDAEVEDLLTERVRDLVTSQSEEPRTTEAPVPLQAPKGKPAKMRLGDQAFELRNSFEILVNTADWLIRSRKLGQADCPVFVSKGKRYLINTEPKHRYGNDFFAPKQLGNGLWIETHYSTAAAIINAKRLLEKFHCQSQLLTIE